MSATEFVLLTLAAVMIGGSVFVATVGWLWSTIKDQRRLHTLMEEDAREAVAPFQPHVVSAPQHAPINGSTSSYEDLA